MIPLAALLALFGAGERIGVRVEDAQGLQQEEAEELAKLLARGIEAATGASVAIDDHLWQSECKSEDRCAAEIRARTGAGELVFVSAFATPSRIRVLVERSEKRSAQADLLRDRSAWPRVLSGFAEILFADGRRLLSTAPAIEAAAPQAESARASVLPGYLAFGGAAILGGVGVAFRLSSNAAAARVDNLSVPTEALAAERDRARSDGVVSNLLIGGAAVLVASGVVYLLMR
jgi:hypothetical protein